MIQPGTAPKTFKNVVRWFQENEAPRGVGKEEDGSISVWFHGKTRITKILLWPIYMHVSVISLYILLVGLA